MKQYQACLENGRIRGSGLSFENESLGLPIICHDLLRATILKYMIKRPVYRYYSPSFDRFEDYVGNSLNNRWR